MVLNPVAEILNVRSIKPVASSLKLGIGDNTGVNLNSFLKFGEHVVRRGRVPFRRNATCSDSPRHTRRIVKIPLGLLRKQWHNENKWIFTVNLRTELFAIFYKYKSALTISCQNFELALKGHFILLRYRSIQTLISFHKDFGQSF